MSCLFHSDYVVVRYNGRISLKNIPKTVRSRAEEDYTPQLRSITALLAQQGQLLLQRALGLGTTVM
ncbi:MAG: hypothetical protein HQK53_16745 [Oligoflexia bacterium]|nr:hypothetical protein [Oligoflexia bacterium]